jgi:DNA-binding GntR family transcriptional regulator
VRTSIAKANRKLDETTRSPINRTEHTAIYDAIKDKDIERARESMRVHIANAMGRLGLATDFAGKNLAIPAAHMRHTPLS